MMPPQTAPAPWSRGRAALVVRVASFFFATSGPLAYLAEPAHPLLIAAGRTTLAALFLSLLFLQVTLRTIRQLPWRSLLKVMSAGLLLAAHFGFFLMGLATTSFAAAVTLVSLEPVAVVLVAWIAFRARPRHGEFLGVALATVGALITTTSGATSHQISGDLMVVASVALYGIYVGAARGFASLMSPVSYAITVYGISGIVLGLLCGGMALQGYPFEAPPHSLWAIGALALIPTLGGHTLVQWSARNLSASMVALVSPGETIGALLIGALLLHQPPTAHELVGASLVLLGVGCTLFSQQKIAHQS